MDYTAAKFWFDIVQTVLIVLVGIQNWLGKRQAVTEGTIKKLEDDLDTKLDAHADRLARVEQELEHVPGKEDFFRVHERLDKVSSELAGVRGEFHAANNILNTIHRYLMERK